MSLPALPPAAPFQLRNIPGPKAEGLAAPSRPATRHRNVRHVVKHKSRFPELSGPISAAGADNEKGFQSQTTAPAKFPLLMNHPQAETQLPGPGCAHTRPLSPPPGTAAPFALLLLHPQPASAARLCSIPGRQNKSRELRLRDVKMLLNFNTNQFLFEVIFGQEAQENGHIKNHKVHP